MVANPAVENNFPSKAKVVVNGWRSIKKQTINIFTLNPLDVYAMINN